MHAAELRCMLQASKADLEKLSTITIDTGVPIVTVVIDCTTDHRNFHLCKQGHDHSCTFDVDDEEMQSRDVLDLAAVLASRRTKDLVPLVVIAEKIANLAQKCHTLGKTLHILLTGCNTVNLVLPLCHQLDSLCPEAKSSVWLLATQSVWPGDMSTFLWSQYGATVSTDLATFRSATATILDEYTTHWRRQKINDPSMHEHARIKSLKELVVLDRLDRVKDDAGFAKMEPL